MPLLENQIGWWPLHAALAWVYTRDVDFVLRAGRKGYTSLEAAIDNYQRDTEASVHPVLDSEDDAWPRLREAISMGKVHARGVPSNVEELSTTCTPSAEEELPPAEAAVLVIEFYFRRISLRTERWIFNEARSWYDVKIARDDLENYFPASTSAAAESQARPSSEKSIPAPTKAHRREAAKELIRAKCGPTGTLPNGVLQDQCFREVNAELTKSGKMQVSLATFRRALRELRREHS